jgi:hypothetical protein
LFVLTFDGGGSVGAADRKPLAPSPEEYKSIMAQLATEMGFQKGHWAYDGRAALYTRGRLPQDVAEKLRGGVSIASTDVDFRELSILSAKVDPSFPFPCPPRTRNLKYGILSQRRGAAQKYVLYAQSIWIRKPYDFCYPYKQPVLVRLAVVRND